MTLKKFSENLSAKFNSSLTLDMTELMSRVTFRFLKGESLLKSVEKSVLPKLTDFKFVNKDLKNAATRLTVPVPFEPYKVYCEQATGRKFPDNLQFTKEEVVDQDTKMIETFSVSNFCRKDINFDYLIQAAIVTSMELGLLRSRKYEKIDIDQSLSMFPQTTSSGFPCFKKKGSEVATSDARNWVTNFLALPTLFNILKQPTAVFHRFQYKIGEDLTSIKKKVRPVWGVSFRVLALSGIYFRNIVDGCTNYCMTQNIPMATWGRTKYDLSQTLIPHMRSYRKDIVSVDVSAFDSNVPSFMWALFYAIIPECIELDNSDLKVLQYLMCFDCFTPFCWRSTNLQFQKKGVPSGSLITSLFDTWVSRVVMNYACLEYTKGKYTAGDTMCALGDDMVFAEVYCSKAHALRTYRKFGLPVHPEKTAVSKYDKPYRFIGYIWDSQNRPMESLEWYVAHLVLPSRFFKVDGMPVDLMQTYRGISICMGLYRGMETFEFLVGSRDRVWKSLLNKYERGEPVEISYIGEDQRLMLQRIPLAEILTIGWKAF